MSNAADDDPSPSGARERTKTRAPIGIVVAALMFTAIGGYVLWDIVRAPSNGAAAPSAKLKVLGRDDPATLEREAELDRKFRARASASVSGAPSGTALPSTNVEAPRSEASAVGSASSAAH